jgi:hypothetical protein
MRVQVGPEQAQVGQAEGGQQDRVARVDVDPVGGVPGGGDAQGRDRATRRLGQPGLGPVLVEGGVALLGRLGGRRRGHPDDPQQDRDGKDDSNEPAHLVTSRVGSSSW